MMIKQPYTCTQCQLESEVDLPDDCGVVQGINIINRDHGRLSHDCNLHVDYIILGQPTFVDQEDDNTVN